MTRAGFAGVLAAAAASLSCGGSTGPDYLAVVLAADAVEGQPLPATLVSWPDYHRELLADTIRFYQGDRFERVSVERFTGFTGTPQIQRRERTGRAVTVAGGIFLAPDCPPDTDCLPGELLVPVEGGYRLDDGDPPEQPAAIHFREAGLP